MNIFIKHFDSHNIPKFYIPVGEINFYRTQECHLIFTCLFTIPIYLLWNIFNSLCMDLSRMNYEIWNNNRKKKNT